MASQLEQTRGKTSAAKMDRFVTDRLRLATLRVRRHDLLAQSLLLLTALALYALTMVVMDGWLDLPSELRLASFALCGAGGAGFLLYMIWQYFGRRINPYYAARQLEKTLPDAKESLINWLDLRGEPLPSLIRQSLGTRAAKDAKRADVEQAIRPHRSIVLASVLGGLLLALLVLFLSSPGQFRSLLARAFLPFREIAIAHRTEIELLEPAAGDLLLRENQSVKFRVQIYGRVPGLNDPAAPRLRYRYTENDPYVDRALVLDPNDEWTATLLPDQILGGGVLYRIAAGDAETPEYRIQVQAPPRIKNYTITYQPRAYRHLPAYTIGFPNDKMLVPEIREFEGTSTVLRIKASRPLRNGYLELQAGKDIQNLAGEILANDPQTLQFRWILRQSGTFRVHYTARDGEPNLDAVPYPIEVLKDQPPEVKLSQPGKDIEAPANGFVPLSGLVRDDIGIKQMTLQLALLREHASLPLQARPYRPEKSFQLVDGGYPQELEYSDVVALDKLHLQNGMPFKMQPGMVLSYWLEAADNCDYPLPNRNVGRSKTYLVRITDPEKDLPKLQQQRKQANQQQRDKEKQQDDKLARQNQQIEKQQQDQQAKQQQEQEFQKKLDELKKTLQQAESKKQSLPQPQPGQAKDKNGGEGQNQGNDAPPMNNKGQEQNKSPQPSRDSQTSQSKDAGQGQQPPTEGKDSGQQNQPKQKDSGQEKQPQPQKGKDGQDQAGDKGGEKNGNSQAGQKSPDMQKPGPNGENDKGQQPGQKEDMQGGNNQSPGQGKEPQPGEQGNNPKDQPKNGANSTKAPGTEKDRKQDGGNTEPGQEKSKNAEAAPRNGGQDKENMGEQAPMADGQKKEGMGQGKEPQQGEAGEKSGNANGKKEGSSAGNASTTTPDEKTAGNHSKKRNEGPAQAKGQEPDNGEKQAPGTKGQTGRQGEKSGHSAGSGGMPKGVAKGPQAGDEADGNKSGGAADSKGGDNSSPADGQNQTANNSNTDGSDGTGKTPSPADPSGGQSGQGGNSEAKAGESGHQQGGGAKGGSPNGDGIGEIPPKGAKAGGTSKTEKKEPPTGEGPEGTLGQNTSGGSDDSGEAGKANSDFANKAGNLQLEDLRKQLTPEVLKKMNWTRDDVERFLEQAKAYQQGLHTAPHKAGELARPGSTASQLPGFSPRQVQGRQDPTRALETGRVLPPAEFAPAYRRLTGEIESGTPPN